VPLAISQYIVHWDSTLASNVAKYIIGTPLGMVFRLWTYRTWVFPKVQPALESEFQFETSERLPTSQLPAGGGRHRRSGSGELLNSSPRW